MNEPGRAPIHFMIEKTYTGKTASAKVDEAPRIKPATAFYLWAYIVVAGMLSAFVLRAEPSTPRAWLFGAAVILTYAFLYSLPTLLVLLGGRILRRRGSIPGLIAEAAIVLTMTVSQLWLAADFAIHGLFGFHINGFVVNLLTTPEGIASMGADKGTSLVCTVIALACLAANALIWWALVYAPWGEYVTGVVTWRGLRYSAIALLVLAVGERITYGISHIQARPDILVVAAALPGYQPTTFRSIAKHFGVEGQRRVHLDARSANTTLDYPKRPLDVVQPAQPLNVVWLVCESLRADMLTPEIMPRTWAFAQENQRFTRHYSGGNGTRMGVFTLFYGLPGSYWFNVLNNSRPPLLMDRFQQLGYELHASTSAAFSYPEFDRTVFSHVPASQLYAVNLGEGWRSDRHHVERIKTWLDGRDDKTPFFAFHFFESAHARYYFPPESVIRKPYLEDFNYATMNLKRDVDLIRNRYVNAVHHLDSQLGEVIDALRAKGILEHTVVVITGDHGEEFLETGRWGHNSEFTEPQVRVPLVVHIPGRAAGVVEYPTSHVDLVPTLLPLLGVRNPTADYSIGKDLFSAAPRLLTFSDWDRIAFSDGSNKAIFPLKAGGQISGRITTADDQPVKDEGTTLRQKGAAMARLVFMMSQYTAGH